MSIYLAKGDPTQFVLEKRYLEATRIYRNYHTTKDGRPAQPVACGHAQQGGAGKASQRPKSCDALPVEHRSKTHSHRHQ